jgi:putative CocE/NonD family hydrolase
VEFDASSTAVDTDWVVSISDVRPDGYAQILRENLLRARSRDGAERTSLMTPGKIYHFSIQMFPISNVFMKGHRVRLSVTSSSFPKWLPNGNTGKENDQDTPGVVATNTIYHDRQHPAKIILPIIPIQTAATSRARR